jgi:dTDP-glucose pyrophosphorylase
LVLDNLDSSDVSRIALVALADSRNSQLDELVDRYQGRLTIKYISKVSGGPAETCSFLFDELDLDQPLVIANSDQYLDFDFASSFSSLKSEGVSGAIWAMRDNHPKWSYVKVDKFMMAIEVREKEVISDLATCGVYGFNRAKDFMDGYHEMVAMGDKTNGEYYVAPVYNYLIAHGKKIKVIDLGEVSKVMHGLGTPEDYEKFLLTKIARSF